MYISVTRVSNKLPQKSKPRMHQLLAHMFLMFT